MATTTSTTTPSSTTTTTQSGATTTQNGATTTQNVETTTKIPTTATTLRTTSTSVTNVAEKETEFLSTARAEDIEQSSSATEKPIIASEKLNTTEKHNKTKENEALESKNYLTSIPSIITEGITEMDKNVEVITASSASKEDENATNKANISGTTEEAFISSIKKDEIRAEENETMSSEFPPSVSEKNENLTNNSLNNVNQYTNKPEVTKELSKENGTDTLKENDTMKVEENATERISSKLPTKSSEKYENVTNNPLIEEKKIANETEFVQINVSNATHERISVENVNLTVESSTRTTPATGDVKIVQIESTIKDNVYEQRSFGEFTIN